jgi:endonuclease/exonuclease/phosphatase family metal-dependent hydrolase
MAESIERIVETLTIPSPEQLQAALQVSATQAEHDRLAAAMPALFAIELRQPGRELPAQDRLRLVAWNAERLKYHDASVAMLAASGADLVLLSEADLGMVRSGNRHTTAELAAALGMGYAYGVEFIELGLGDAREQLWHAGENNIAGLHGNALLSKLPLTDLTLIRFAGSGRWFNGRDGEQRRLGGRMALAARLRLGEKDVVAVSVHLESDSDAADRFRQMEELLAALDHRYGDAAMVIGGDCNTAALPPAIGLDDVEDFEPLFTVMRKNRFDWRRANDRMATQRTRPDGSPKPPFRRIDWLFTRGLVPAIPHTIAAVDDYGLAISDHEAIAVDISISG